MNWALYEIRSTQNTGMYVCMYGTFLLLLKPSYPQNTDHGNVKCSSLPLSLLSLRVCAVCKFLQVIFSCVMASLHHGWHDCTGPWVRGGEGLGETGWKHGSIRGKIDCRMQSYADKPFIVLYFSVHRGGWSWGFLAVDTAINVIITLCSRLVTCSGYQ